MKKTSKKAIILLSGGLDSAVTLYYAKARGYKLTAIIFDYSQRHKKEIVCAKKLCRINKIDYRLIKIDLSWVNSSLTNKNIKVPLNRKLKAKDIPVTYVSGRNIIFLSYAFSLAETLGVTAVFIGAHTQDYSGYPDCRPQFLKHFQAAVVRGLNRQDIKLIAPLIDKSKKEIVELGLGLGVPFQHTWSCYQGDKKPCLKCDSCRFRVAAFNQKNAIEEVKTS
jgi:7-cyano-7-deazaguanine synthase